MPEIRSSNIQASDFKLFDPANFGAPGSLTGLDDAGGPIAFGVAMGAAGAGDSNGAPVLFQQLLRVAGVRMTEMLQ